MTLKYLIISSFLIVGLSISSTINAGNAKNNNLFLEAESFTNKGGWVIDQQFMELMGSSYLMAHGLGNKVKDASTSIIFPEKGTYYVYARTFNWTAQWSNKKGPGQFKIKVGNTTLYNSLGCTGNEWEWQYAGAVKINQNQATIYLKDITGFNGRCDAIYFTKIKGDVPPNDVKKLDSFRKQKLNYPSIPKQAGSFDVVIVGGGIAGMCAAVSAARFGCKVALINDRPILGGNNSSDVRVHLGGRINVGPYKELGNMIKEFGPSKRGNAQPKENYEDQKKSDWIANEKNVFLFPSMKAIAVEKNGDKITKVTARNIETGEDLSFSAPIFSDCTGDGSIGYLAGADYKMGRESKNEFNESRAPEKADKMTMGASCQWYSKDDKKNTKFPLFEYGVNFTEQSCEKVEMGEWTWETGMNYNQITDAEYIRDYGLMVVFSNWSFLKNKFKNNANYKCRSLDWVAYVAGKRESRRLMGDYILKEEDITRQIIHEDASAATSWSIDLHYPDPLNSEYFQGEEFKSIAKHTRFYPYPVPYRCLYSRNVSNLFMAGRDISVTHVALGTVRVMRTCGMMGEVVGMAASLCKKYRVTPRDIYRYHFNEMKDLMNEGAGKKDLPDNQTYTLGGTSNSSVDIKEEELNYKSKGKQSKITTTIITYTSED